MTQALELKDYITASIALAALVTSISVAVLNYRLEKDRRKSDAHKRFSEAVLGLSSVRKEWEDKRKELAEKYYDSESAGVRGMLADRRSFFISQLISLYRQDRSIGTHFEHLILAASLMDRGRVGEATEHYRIAALRSPDRYSKAEALRVYGRAVFGAGERAQGRSIMEEAVAKFLTLSTDKDFDRDPMLLEVVETYRRLAYAELQTGHHDKAVAIVEKIESLLGGIGAEARVRGEASVRELLEWLVKVRAEQQPPADLQNLQPKQPAKRRSRSTGSKPAQN